MRIKHWYFNWKRTEWNIWMTPAFCFSRTKFDLSFTFYFGPFGCRLLYDKEGAKIAKVKVLDKSRRMR